MGKIKGFLFAVRHREILMTDLGLSVIPKHPETKRRYPYCLCRAVESAVGHADSADVDGLMAAVAGKPMMGSLEQV